MNRFRTLIYILPVAWIALFLNFPILEYEDTAEKLRSAMVRYLKDVNYPLVQGIENRVLIWD